MWRTVIVTQGEKLTVKDNWLVVWSDNNEQRVPIGDLYSVVIDNRASLIFRSKQKRTGGLIQISENSLSKTALLWCSTPYIPAQSEITMMRKSIAG